MNATFLLRLKAFLFDYIIILCYLIILFFINIFLFPSLQEFFTGSIIVAQLTGFIMVTLPVSIYFIITDSSIVGQSFGKRRTGIRIINKNGAPLSIIHVTFRTILKFLPWELSHFLVYRLIYLGESQVPTRYYIIGGIIYGLIFTYIFTAIFTKKKQALYDIIAKTEVIKE
ncbi:RDD family protein [Evansella sp. AB-P1]|uniref:RDD family protein n=1 Tax=Evansella sp. AB-P1 TaxID=3037653 RepID=UPI00241CC81D|nr:RDD family protein [Evansella sp. AB-P1]MDG5786793.1 RDD family protein [Evansella sp. AB-P1]